MTLAYELDSSGCFCSDIVVEQGFIEACWWTFDQPPQSAQRLRYTGGDQDEESRQCYGGVWVDEGASEQDALHMLCLLAELNAECDRRLALLKQAYPESEVLSWDKQEAEAKAGGGPLVAALAVARGIDQGELISRILQKAQVFAVLSGTIIGQRQALEDQVKAGARLVEWP